MATETGAALNQIEARIAYLRHQRDQIDSEIHLLAVLREQAARQQAIEFDSEMCERAALLAQEKADG